MLKSCTSSSFITASKARRRILWETVRESSFASSKQQQQQQQQHRRLLLRSNETSRGMAQPIQRTRRRCLSASAGPGNKQSSSSSSPVTRTISSTSPATQPTTAKSLLEFGVRTKGSGQGKNVLPLDIVLHPTTKTLLPIVGNVAYMAIASGFLMTDMLGLRVMLIGGYTGLVAFHTLHERPLRIPLRWSALFVLVNAGAAALLIADRYAPSLNSDPNFTEDGEDLYREHFAMLTRGQCQQLFRLAHRQHIPAGTILTKENIPCDKMFFLVKGQAHVYHGKTNVLQGDDDEANTSSGTEESAASNNTAADVWFYNNNNNNSTGSSSTRNVPPPPPPPHYTHNIATIDLGGFVNDVAFQQDLQEAKTNNNGNGTMSNTMVGAYGTVITVEDCDVLVWDTAELRRHMTSRPDMDKNMKYCLSNHLVKSLMRQREAAHKRQLLQQHLLLHNQQQ